MYVHAITMSMKSGDSQGITVLDKSDKMIPELDLINRLRTQFNDIIGVKYQFVMAQSSYQQLIDKD